MTDVEAGETIDEDGGVEKPLEDPVDETDDDLKKPVDEVEDEPDELEETKLTELMWKMSIVMKIVGLICLVVYLMAAFIIDFQRAKGLFIMTVLTIATLGLTLYSKKNPEVFKGMEDSVVGFLDKTETDSKYGLGVLTLLVFIMGILMGVSVESGRNMISLLGLVVFILVTWLTSWKPGAVKWRPVVGATFLQFVFGYIVIRTAWGFSAIQFAADQFTILLGYTTAGSSFVFAWLTDGSLFGRPFALAGEDAGVYFLGPPFFFNVLPSVVFFSALVSMGYYLRIIPWAVSTIGYFLSICLGTSASESISASGNIFIGQTEAPLLVRPFMSEMTESELFAIMVGGFATIAGSVFGVYVSFGIDPVAILASSVMSAPAALAMAKLAYPETEDSKTGLGKKGVFDIPKSDDVNVVHAASNGAVVGMQLVLNIAGNLIAVLAILAFLDVILGWLGNMVDIFLSFNAICEVVFYPCAWLMGVDAADCRIVASLIGYKIFANEFVAYEKLAFTYKGLISDRSYYIASYALCGFSNVGSIGIQLGGLTPLAPNQGKKLAKLVTSAMIVGNTACFMTACIAGIFYRA